MEIISTAGYGSARRVSFLTKGSYFLLSAKCLRFAVRRSIPQYGSSKFSYHRFQRLEILVVYERARAYARAHSVKKLVSL